jgi:hypothetical protein
VCAHQGVERLVQLATDDLLAVDQEPDEDRLVQDAAYRLVALGVPPSRLIEQALAAADDQAGSEPYRYLQQLQRLGKLRLRTLEVDAEDSQDIEP